MQEVMIFASILTPIILGLTEVVKLSVKFPANYVPLVALVIGVVVGILGGTFDSVGLSLETRIWSGVVSALAATGLFEMVFKDRPGVTK